RGGGRVIYVRSRRPLLTLVGTATAFAFSFAIAGWVAWGLPKGAWAAAALWGAATGMIAIGAWACLRLRSWPPCRLAFFRDRLVVLSGKHELRALWDQVQAVTLADMSTWPNIRITDSVTLTFQSEGPMRFRPADFGLDAAGCRDLLARLRDQPELRERLP